MCYCLSGIHEKDCLLVGAKSENKNRIWATDKRSLCWYFVGFTFTLSHHLSRRYLHTHKVKDMYLF